MAWADSASTQLSQFGGLLMIRVAGTRDKEVSTSSSAPGAEPAGGWSAAKPQPAGPAAGVAYDGFGIRALAFILDAIAIGVISTALIPLLGAGSMVRRTSGRSAGR